MYDILIRNGMIYDGSGGKPYAGCLAISGDSIAAVGALDRERGALEIDAGGKAVAPGFVNMLSHAQVSLLADGRSQSDIRQGVTLEVMGEGMQAMGPLSDAMKRDRMAAMGNVSYTIDWTTLGEYLDHVVARGVSCNVASFTSASAVRVNVLGHVDRAPDAAELRRMEALVAQSMEQGAMGMSSSLIYAPDCYADTQELTALATVVGRYGGMYISHVRNEGSRILEAFDELIAIARSASCAAEIYHLKVAGKENWGKLDAALAKVEQARAGGLAITADMYTYIAAGTKVSSDIPGWAHEGGRDALLARLRDPAARERIKADMAAGGGGRDFRIASLGPENIMLVSFKSPEHKELIGRTLADIAALRGKPADEVLLDLVLEDEGNPAAVFFAMSEDNVRRQVALPWVSFGSDAPSQAAEGVFLKSGVHPRAYGNFARLLDKYVRTERVVPLEEAIRRLTLLPATNLKIQRRGALRAGHYADIVVFDPNEIREHATFQDPHHYATGMAHVFVNGVHVLKDAEHTGATPGRVVRGPGWR